MPLTTSKRVLVHLEINTLSESPYPPCSFTLPLLPLPSAMITQTLTKAVQQRPNATSRKKRAQPSKTRLPVLRPVVADTFSPTWATGIMRFSTIYGTLNITNEQLQALKSVPRDGPREDRPTYAHIARTRSGMASRGRRITFTIQGGAAAAYIAGYGMPVYALATVSESELLYHMQSPLDTVMPSLGRRNIRIRIQVSAPEVVHGNLPTE